MNRLLLIFALCIMTSFAYGGDKLVFSSGEGTLIHFISERVLKEAYADIGYDVEVMLVPNARSPVLANSGEMDGELARVEGLEKDFPDLIRVPVAVNIIEGYVFSSDPSLAVRSWEDLKSCRVVCVRGAIFAESNMDSRNIDYYKVDSFSLAVRLVHLGRYDAAILTEVNGLDAVRETGFSDVMPVGEPLTVVSLYHYVHVKNAVIVPLIQAALEKMRDSGRIAQIREEFIEENF